tara:strand:+ start:240 stop:527 length:288 start_codon:yes stop_codon:yes gene_type:complete
MGKRGKQKKEKHQQYRTLEERKQDTRPIIEKLAELKLTTIYEEVKTLLKTIQTYIRDGERIEINIPFPCIGRRMIGVLATNVNEQVWVKMEKEQF